jgi:hypothetical protein
MDEGRNTAIISQIMGRFISNKGIMAFPQIPEKVLYLPQYRYYQIAGIVLFTA